MKAILTDVILKRTVGGVNMQCGYNKLTVRSKFTPFIKVGDDVTQYADIIEARAAFWKAAKR